MWTKGKWYIDKSGLRIRAKSGSIVYCDSERENNISEQEHLANARRICQCVNNFDELLNISKKLLSCLRAAKAYPQTFNLWNKEIQKAEQAIANAEKGD
jgi:hypothetical protein